MEEKVEEGRRWRSRRGGGGEKIEVEVSERGLHFEGNLFWRLYTVHMVIPS